MLYSTAWNGYVEGPTWNAWWTQNSYGPTYTILPYADSSTRNFIRNANLLWFNQIGNGTRVGNDDPHPGPDGCLCDAAGINVVYYKQGDGNVAIHDWALEETLSGVIMEAERILIDRNFTDYQFYLPLFNRTLNLIESRRDSSTNLFLFGDASNLLAPSYGAFLQPNGTRLPAYLTGASVSYIAALDRVIEIERLAGGIWTSLADIHTQRRDLTFQGLPALLAPDTQDYFVKWKDPNGTLHGVLNQSMHNYIEAVVNHDAIAFGVAERIQTGLNDAIMNRLTGPTVPVNPVTGGPGLRPYSLVTTNAASLDDMEYPPTSWLWQYGTWVNGGEWATCESRMMMAYYRTNRAYFALDSMRALLGFANIFRMDSPLVNWGSEVYQPDEPINIVYDMFGIPTAFLRGLWDPVYSATNLTFTPHIPGNVTNLTMTFPILWGPHLFFLSSLGNASAGGITNVQVNGAPWPSLSYTATDIVFLWSALPTEPTNFTVVITFNNGLSSDTQSLSTDEAVYLPPVSEVYPIHPLTRTTSVRALRGLIPSDPLLWFEADTIKQSNNSPLVTWTDSTPNQNKAVQFSPSAQPLYLTNGMNNLPTVVFNGNSTFLQGNITVPATLTIIGVFTDFGETNVCCTGIFYANPSCAGMGTRQGTSNTTILMIDWSGSGDGGQDDLTHRQVVASVVYNSTGAYSYADGCLQSTETGILLPSVGSTFMIGSRNNEDQRYFNGYLSELIIYPYPLNDTDRENVENYLGTKWPRPNKPLSCLPPPPNCTLPVNLQTMYTQLSTFIINMRKGGFADAQYELAHAILMITSTDTWTNRCNGLNNGTIVPLASRASESAADTLYVNTPTNLGTGLISLLTSYANTVDPTKQKIYSIWENSQ